jgi:hypothetical protein
MKETTFSCDQKLQKIAQKKMKILKKEECNRNHSESRELLKLAIRLKDNKINIFIIWHHALSLVDVGCEIFEWLHK